MNRRALILLGMLLLPAGCREKEPSRLQDPVLEIGMLSVRAEQATVQMKALNAVSVRYGVGLTEEDAGEMPLSVEPRSLGRPFPVDLTGLLPETTYIFCAQGVGSDGTSGEMKTLSFTTSVAEGALYPWEKARPRLPLPADMTLIPGPSSHREPLAWNRDRWKTHVSYTDEDGVEHWLFDSFLLIEGQQTGTYGSPGYTYVLTESSVPSAPKALWQQLLDFWFDGGTFEQQESYWGDGVNTFGRWYTGQMVSPAPSFADGQLQALDDCIGEVAGRIGEPPSKRYVIMSLPEPVFFDNYITAVSNPSAASSVYWGTLDGRELDFSRVGDRILACKWFIDETRAAFARKQYRYIELLGFYILPEVLSLTWRTEYKKYDEIFPALASYLHGLNEGLYWIPYNLAEGYKVWKNFGIDMAYMQPNYYWDEEGKHPMNRTFQEIDKYGMGLELEFEYSMVEAVNGAQSAQKYRARFDEYLAWAKSSGVYGTRSIALYSGTDAMEQLATSTLPDDRAMYHKLGHFIIESPLKK